MAIKRAGTLTKKLGLPKAKAPQVKLRKASSVVPKMGKAANITTKLSGFNKKKDPMVY